MCMPARDLFRSSTDGWGPAVPCLLGREAALLQMDACTLLQPFSTVLIRVQLWQAGTEAGAQQGALLPAVLCRASRALCVCVCVCKSRG